MYPRINYEMTEDDLKDIVDACRPVPCIMIGSIRPRSQQENANNAWKILGNKMGFDSETVEPIPGKSNRFFTAVPCETAYQKEQRLLLEQREKFDFEIKTLQSEIKERQEKLDKLLGG